MNYYKDAEEKLEKYKTYNETINILNTRLNKLKLSGAPRDISAVDFGNVGHSSGGQKDALQLFAEVQHVQKQIAKVKAEKELIEQTIATIEVYDPIVFNFIRHRYLLGQSLEETADKLGYSINSKASIYNLKDKSLSLFIRFYWGE